MMVLRFCIGRVAGPAFTGETQTRERNHANVTFESFAIHKAVEFASANSGGCDVNHCRISSSGSVLGGMRSQVVLSLSEKRKAPLRPESTSSSRSSRQVERPMPAIEASQPGFTVIR